MARRFNLDAPEAGEVTFPELSWDSDERFGSSGCVCFVQTPTSQCKCPQDSVPQVNDLRHRPALCSVPTKGLVPNFYDLEPCGCSLIAVHAFLPHPDSHPCPRQGHSALGHRDLLCCLATCSGGPTAWVWGGCVCREQLPCLCKALGAHRVLVQEFGGGDQKGACAPLPTAPWGHRWPRDPGVQVTPFIPAHPTVPVLSRPHPRHRTQGTAHTYFIYCPRL